MKSPILPTFIFTSLTCITGLSHTAVADIAYDSITSFSALPTQQFTVLPVQGDDVTLDDPAGLTLTHVDVLTRLRSMASFAEFSGTVTLRVYANDDFFPGSVLAEATMPLTVARGTDVLAGFDFPNIVLPDRSIVVGWYFTMAGRPNVFNDMWVRQNADVPSVGSTNEPIYASNIETPTNWQVGAASDRNYAIRVTTIPAPGTAGLALLSCAGLATRRRRGHAPPTLR